MEQTAQIQEYIKTLRKRWTVRYFNWELFVTLDDKLIVIKDNEVREYEIETPSRIEESGQYVYLYFGNFLGGRKQYQVKFEEGNFLVIDIIDVNGDFESSFGNHVFGEDI